MSASVSSAAGTLGQSVGEGGVIAFYRAVGQEKRGGIYVMDATGRDERLLARGGWWALSPDGRRLAFNDYGVGPLYVVGRDETGLRRLARGIAGGELAWSPDSQKVAFLTYRRARNRSRPNGRHELTQVTRGDDETPAWSSDGRLALVRYTGFAFVLVVVNADGSGERILKGTTSVALHPAWSPRRNETPLKAVAPLRTRTSTS